MLFCSSALKSKPDKRDPETESVEMRMDFDEESLVEAIPPDYNGARSIVDSGVGNTSVHSDDNEVALEDPNQDQGEKICIVDRIAIDEGPVMTSSPRPSRDDTSDKVQTKVGDNHLKGLNSQSVVADTQSHSESTSGLLTLENTGETETDVEIEEDEPDERTKQKELPVSPTIVAEVPTNTSASREDEEDVEITAF